MRSRTANKMPYLVNVAPLCKAEVLDTLVFDASRKVVAKERVDDVLERRAVCIAGA